jgi:hypothetical protein
VVTAMARLFLVTCVLLAGISAVAQVLADEAYRRLHDKDLQRQAVSRPQIAPATAPSPTIKVGTKTTVFIIENRGSMLPDYDSLQTEIGKAINALPPDNGFNVFWFEDGKPKSLVPAPLLATDLNKRKAYGAILETSAVGTHDGDALFSAIRNAYAMNVDVVWLISKGFGDSKECDALLAAIQKSAFRNMRINTTIKFTNRDDKIQRSFLLRLSEQSKGICIGEDGEIVSGETARTKPEPEREAPLPATLPSGPSIFRDR